MEDKLEQIKKKIQEEEDYIYAPKFGYSLSKLMEDYPDGIEKESYIAKVLMMSEKDVEKNYLDGIESLQEMLGIEKKD